MDNKDLRNLLLQLHNEIENAQAVDEQDTELLQHLEGDINSLLARSGKNPARVQPSTVDRLELALSRFEITHPSLTVAISKVLDSLSGAGV